MTNPNYTAIAILVDRSASMQHLSGEMTQAIAGFIEGQKKLDGYCTVRLDQFDTVFENVYKSTHVGETPNYTLIPRGSTALNDSFMRTLNEFGAELRAKPESERPGKVLVVVVTDGEENSSRDTTKAQVKAKVENQRNTYDWDFVYLGANQDAVLTGEEYGFKSGSSLTYAPTASGVAFASASLGNYATTMRSGVKAAFTESDREEALTSV